MLFVSVFALFNHTNQQCSMTFEQECSKRKEHTETREMQFAGIHLRSRKWVMVKHISCMLHVYTQVTFIYQFQET